MFEINKDYFGFKLVEESNIDELQSVARVFYHEKSGARLLQLENEDDNKVFSIGFRTPPSDSTGVPHILEHCVLSGSRKYTTKEPFMDMVKGSLQTFINAMTYSDKTLYPVASRNEKDFFNLMDVYLDAVLYPKIYEIRDIFMQEGWHHEIFNKEDKITYKGVVYNEMKGAYSSPETILANHISESLFPDTCYKYSSGGDPEVIPELTYEAFLDFHRKLYHPSNSYIYLYGNGDISKQLEFINESYLSNFDKIEVDSKIHRQASFESRVEVSGYYPISSDENDENRDYLSMNFVLKESSKVEDYLMNKIIAKALIDSPSAPLKKALIDAGIGEDIFAMDMDQLQPAIGIVAKNTSIGRKEEFEAVIFKTLNELVSNGLDKKLIEACINMVEYDLREASRFPTKGIIYNLLSLDSWLYDGEPTEYLRYGAALNALRDQMDTDYFANYIKESFIDNPHSSLVMIEPKKGLGEEKEKITENKLKEYKESLSEEELEILIAENIKLKEMQLSDDTEEAKETIPKLDLSDVDSGAEKINQEIIKDGQRTLLFHNIFTSNIAYVDFYFDTSMVEEKNIPYINLLAGLLGQIDTKNKGYGELSNEIYIHTGGIEFDAMAFIKDGEDNQFSPRFVVKGKAIGNNITKLMALTSELIQDTKLEDEKRIKELLQQIKSRIEMSIIQRGNAVVANRVGSYFSRPLKYTEKLKGLDFYWFISELVESFENKKEEILCNLNEVYHAIFNKNNLFISFTGDEADLSVVREHLPIVIENLKEEAIVSQEYDLNLEKLNEGILSSANVQYVSKGYDFSKLGYDYNGSMRVLSIILSGDYLHNRIRAQGGAYGAGISFEKPGYMTAFSYRDPNLKETIEVYDNMADYIANLKLNESELTQFIIGTISRLEPAMTPHMKGQLKTARYISNITDKDIQRIKDEVLSTTLAKIKDLAPLLDGTMKENYLCVLGNENKIKENKEIFNKLVKLMK